MSVKTRTARAVVFHPGDTRRLLLMERRKSGAHYFTLPGGHIELNETPTHAVEREVLEETSLHVHVVRLLNEDDDALGNHQYIFLCRYESGEVRLPPESIEARNVAATGQTCAPGWFALDALAEETVYPANLRQFLRSHTSDPR